MITKEERFKELISDLYTGDYSVDIIVDGSLKNIEWFNSKGEWLIHYDEEGGYTDIRYHRIWSVFQKEYDMKYDDIQQFMKDMLFTHLKIKETTPINYTYKLHQLN